MNEFFSLKITEKDEEHEKNEITRALGQAVIEDKLLQAIYKATELLLVPGDDENIDSPIVKSLEVLGRFIGADRVHLWRCETRASNTVFNCLYYWLSEIGEQKPKIPSDVKPPFKIRVIWENKFARNEHLGGPISKLTPEEQEYFKAFDIKSVVIIPLFLNKQLWGLASIDDCTRERDFLEDEINISRSISLMIANLIDNRFLASKIAEAMDSIEYRDKLLMAVNQIAGYLLNSEVESFEKALDQSMNTIAEAVKVDGIYIWKNYSINNRLYCSQLYEWPEHRTIFYEDKKLYCYEEIFPGWGIFLLHHGGLNGPMIEMPPALQKFLSPAGILSILVVPIFIDDQFWGFVGFDDCRTERVFTQEEESILRSAGILIVNAIIRDEMTHDILDKTTRLEMAIKETHEATIAKNNTLNALENILNSLDASVYVTVPNTGELLFVNTHLKKFFNVESEDVIGKRCYKVFRNSEDICSFCPCRQSNNVDSDEPVVWDEYLPDAGLYMRRSDSYIDWPDGRRVHLQHSVDITEMVKASEEARLASQAKSDFLSNMSHEMRTPMNAIVGMTAIGKKANDLEGKDNALNKIDDASSHLLGVINDILDMAKIEANKLEIAFVEYNFEKMIQKVLAIIRFRADEKQQELTAEIDKKIPCFVIGDDQRLAQVITNLLSNAVKFSHEGGKIHMSVSLDGENDGCYDLRIEVTDNGIGMSPKQQEKLFDAFEQAHNKISRDYGGTGLGLTITKRIVEMMFGRIWVESELGKGSKFICMVQVARGSKNDEPSGEAANCCVKTNDGNGLFAGKRLLIVEDIEINREILIVLLEDSGLLIDSAVNGKEALDMVTAEPEKYDLIFMDLRMPKMDGLEATRHIRALPPRQRGWLPIVAMTANVFKEDVKTCLDAGMDDHFGKPVDIDRVMEVLHKYL